MDNLKNKSISSNKRKMDITDDVLESMTKEQLIHKIKALSAYNIQLKSSLNGSRTENNSITKGKRKRPFDFSKCHRRKVLLKFYYLGWDYAGFASQDHTTKTIEHHIFAALTKGCLIESRETSNYHRCGRTDKGVSSFSQVISIEVRSKFPEKEQMDPDSIANEINYVNLLNRLLSEEIRFVAWLPLRNPKFSARFDCNSRTYRYFFPRGNLNIERMEEASQFLIGVHDFRNLCKMDVANGVTAFIRSIDKATITVSSKSQENPSFDMITFEITGKAFLWHQIRCIMSILILVGSEKEEPDIIKELLDVDKNPSKPQYSLASDLPLNLYNVQYRDYSLEGVENSEENVIKEDLTWIYDKDNLTRVVSDLQKQWTVQAVKKEMMKQMIDDLSHELIKVGGSVIKDQTEDLIEGAKTKKYIKLMDRPLCPTLENRIDHYAKKRKLEVPLETVDDDK